MALFCSVHGGPADPKQVGEFCGAVFPGFQQSDQMGFLPRVELGLLTPEPTFRLRALHALPGPQPDQVGFENSATVASMLNSNRPTASLGSCTEAPQAEPDLPGGRLVGDGPRIGQRTGQPVQFGDHQNVSFPAGGHRFPKSRPFPVGTG